MSVTPQGFVVEFPEFEYPRDYWSLAAIVAESVVLANVHSDKDDRSAARRQLKWGSRHAIDILGKPWQPVRLACAIPDGSEASCLEICCLEAARLRRASTPAMVVINARADGTAHAVLSVRGIWTDPSEELGPQLPPTTH